MLDNETPAPVAERAREDETQVAALAKEAWQRLFHSGVACGDAYSRDQVIGEICGAVKAAQSALLATCIPDDPALDATDAAHPAWWRGQEHGCQRLAERWKAALDGESHGGVMALRLGQECRERTQAVLAENQRLREDLDIARAEGIRWANAAEVEQGRREEAEGEAVRLKGICTRVWEIADVGWEQDGDPCAALRQICKLTRPVWDVKHAAVLAGRGERTEAVE